MRRTRGFAWYHILFAIPVVAVAFGIQYFMRQHYPAKTGAETAELAKPSTYRTIAADQDAKSAEDEGHGKSAQGKKADKHEAKPEKNGKQEKSAKPVHAEADHEEETVAHERALSTLTDKHGETTARVAIGHGHEAEAAKTTKFADERAMERSISAMKEAGRNLAAPKVARTSVAPEVTSPHGFTDRVDAEGLNVGTLSSRAPAQAGRTDQQCVSVEFRGEGPTRSASTPADWSKVVDLFLEAKKDLGQWMERNKRGFSEKTWTLMDRQLRAVKLQKPPVAEEPDLAWRGIGVFGRDAAQNPVVRIGPGFVKLVARAPERAKFETIRLLAQAWAPCELAREDASEPWSPLLACLQVNEKQACAPESVSEGGWAVSSALAAMLARPGCEVPAFHEPAVARCLQKFPFPQADRGIAVSSNRESNQ